MARVDAVERVLNLVALLHEAGQPLTRAEIVARMGTGSTPYPDDPDALHQQFSADRRALTAVLGVPLRQRVRSGTDAGATEYWLDPADVHLPPIELAEDERVVLALALGAIRRSVPWAGEAALKLGATKLGATPRASARSGVSIDAPVEPPIDLAVRVPDTVVRAVEAARRGVVVRLQGGDVDRGVGLVPVSVVLEGGAWYLLGLPAPAVPQGDAPAAPGAPVAHRLTSRTSLEATDRPVGASWSRRLDRETIDRLVGRAGGPPRRATVRVDHDTALRASTSASVIARRDGDADGTVLLDVEVADPDRFLGWLVELGEGAVLEEPEDLRAAMVDRLVAIRDHEPSGRPAPPRPPAVGARRPGPEPAVARLHRLLTILPWLTRNRSVPVAEIAGRIGVSPERLVRDLTLASMCGVPPYTADALFGFWVEPGPQGDMVHVSGPHLIDEPVRLTAR